MRESFHLTRVRGETALEWGTELSLAVEETYRGHRVTITRLTIPNQIIGRNGIAGTTWLIAVNGQDVTREVLRLRVDDTADVLEAAKAYVDKMMS